MSLVPFVFFGLVAAAAAQNFNNVQGPNVPGSSMNPNMGPSNPMPQPIINQGEDDMDHHEDDDDKDMAKDLPKLFMTLVRLAKMLASEDGPMFGKGPHGPMGRGPMSHGGHGGPHGSGQPPITVILGSPKQDGPGNGMMMGKHRPPFPFMPPFLPPFAMIGRRGPWGKNDDDDEDEDDDWSPKRWGMEDDDEDDDEDFLRSFMKRRFGDDDEDEDEDDDDEEGGPFGGRGGPWGRGRGGRGRGEKKKCKKVIKFLLWLLKMKRGREGRMGPFGPMSGRGGMMPWGRGGMSGFGGKPFPFPVGKGPIMRMFQNMH